MTDFSRRHFFKTASLPLGLAGLATAAGSASAAATTPVSGDAEALHWLDGAAPALPLGATLGLPWPRGQHGKSQQFHALDAQGQVIANLAAGVLARRLAEVDGPCLAGRRRCRHGAAHPPRQGRHHHRPARDAA
jgi:hypothetical protein